MTAATRTDVISVTEYLASEEKSPFKREYLGGFVYAMAGASNPHTFIASNAEGMLYSRLRGRKCRSLNSDTKIRARMSGQFRFYYPDVSVVCHPHPLRNLAYQDKPTVIVEVLSKDTRRIDEGEKKEAYLTIRTLRVYLLIEQDEARVVAYRRKKDSFIREVYSGLDAVVPLPEIGAELPLAELYEMVEFSPEPEDDQDAAED